MKQQCEIAKNPLSIKIDEDIDINDVSLNPGDHFANLEIISQLGSGGMGVVYLAREIYTDRLVALKLVQSQGDTYLANKQRFLQEIKALAKLQHPNIVKFLSFDSDPVDHYTMEYIEGQSIKSIMGKNDWRALAKVFEKIFSAIAVVHDNGIVHRDLKPSNIMLSGDEPKIMDFGLAKLGDNSCDLTKSGCIVGSFAYMSPEQINASDVDCRADIYALGASMYHLLTERPPFQGENVYSQINRTEPVEPRKLNADIPTSLEAICLKCMEKDRRQRYTSATQVAQDLYNFQHNLPVSARPITTTMRMRKFFQRNSVACSSILAAIMCFALSFLWYINNHHNEQEKTILAKQDAEHQAPTRQASFVKSGAIPR